ISIGKKSGSSTAVVRLPISSSRGAYRCLGVASAIDRVQLARVSRDMVCRANLRDARRQRPRLTATIHWAKLLAASLLTAGREGGQMAINLPRRPAIEGRTGRRYTLDVLPGAVALASGRYGGRLAVMLRDVAHEHSFEKGTIDGPG